MGMALFKYCSVILLNFSHNVDVNKNYDYCIGGIEYAEI